MPSALTWRNSRSRAAASVLRHRDRRERRPPPRAARSALPSRCSRCTCQDAEPEAQQHDRHGDERGPELRAKPGHRRPILNAVVAMRPADCGGIARRSCPPSTAAAAPIAPPRISGVSSSRCTQIGGENSISIDRGDADRDQRRERRSQTPPGRRRHPAPRGRARRPGRPAAPSAGRRRAAPRRSAGSGS